MSAKLGGPPLASFEVVAKTGVSSVDSGSVGKGSVEGREGALKLAGFGEGKGKTGVKAGALGEEGCLCRSSLGPLVLLGWWGSLGRLSPVNGAPGEWEV